MTFWCYLIAAACAEFIAIRFARLGFPAALMLLAGLVLAQLAVHEGRRR